MIIQSLRVKLELSAKEVQPLSLNCIRNPIKRLDPLWTWRFLMHYVHMVYVLDVSCFKFQHSMMSGTPSKTPLSTIPCLDPLPWRFHVLNFNSLLYDVKNPINLKHNLQIVYVLQVPCFKFQLSVKS